MFSEIPKLFGREFAIAHFIPSAILVISLDNVISKFGIDVFIDDEYYQKWLGVAVYILVTWAIGVVLMAINFQLVRFLEGYGRLNPLKFRKTRTRRIFMENALSALDTAKMIDHAREQNQPIPDVSADFVDKLRSAVFSFPHEERFLLPTKLGNHIRAFEVYSRVVYGIDAIPSWPRLAMLLPDQVRNQINHSRAVFDFAANLVFTSFIVILLYIALCAWSRQIAAFWIPIVYASMFLFSKYMLDTAAKQWGEQVKSAFDLYRGDLANQMGLELPQSADREREMWGYVNRMMIFRSKASAKGLDKFRKTRDCISKSE